MSSDEENAPPLILHCHIPKTAGTTVSEGLRKSFNLYHFHHFHPDPFYILTRDVLEDLLQINPSLRSITSHNLRSFPLSIANRGTFFVTFLRRPEDAFISTLRFAQREFFTFPPEVRRLWPKDTPQLPLRELARQYLDLTATCLDLCTQTRFFCSPSATAEFGLCDGHSYGLNSYEIAFSILQQFHFVGVVEEMKKSLQVLTDLLWQRGIRVYFDLNLKMNASPEHSRPTWLNSDDEIGKRVFETGTTDRLLYDYFHDSLLESYRRLRSRCWLGARPAVRDAIEAFPSQRWRGVTRSMVNSGRLFWQRQRPDHSPIQVDEVELSTDTLEVRAARAFVEEDQRKIAQARRREFN
jgi:hypothetical protein